MTESLLVILHLLSDFMSSFQILMDRAVHFWMEGGKQTSLGFGPNHWMNCQTNRQSEGVCMLLIQTAVWVWFVAARGFALMEGKAMDKCHSEFWSPARLEVHGENWSENVNEPAAFDLQKTAVWSPTAFSEGCWAWPLSILMQHSSGGPRSRQSGRLEKHCLSSARKCSL